MKLFANAMLVVLGLSALFSSGCATPAYTWDENVGRISRNWVYENQVMFDDIDSVMLFRPVTKMSIWDLE